MGYPIKISLCPGLRNRKRRAAFSPSFFMQRRVILGNTWRSPRFRQACYCSILILRGGVLVPTSDCWPEHETYWRKKQRPVRKEKEALEKMDSPGKLIVVEILWERTSFVASPGLNWKQTVKNIFIFLFEFLINICPLILYYNSWCSKLQKATSLLT